MLQLLTVLLWFLADHLVHPVSGELVQEISVYENVCVYSLTDQK